MKLKKSTSVLGDALDVLARLPNSSFDACIADPPYNMSKKKGLGWAFSKHVTMEEAWDRFSKEEYFGFCFKWITEVCRVVKPNGNLFLFGTYHNIYTMGFILQQLDLKILNSIVWVKPNAQPNITCRMFTHMNIEISIPEALRAPLQERLLDLNRAALEGVAVSAYRRGVLSMAQVGELLCLDSRWATQRFLSEMGAWPSYDESNMADELTSLSA